MNDERSRQFESLYRRYYRRVVRFYVQVFRLSEEDAEELAQDAFFRFYRGLDEYRGDAEWAFLETIARNVAYNRIRATKTKKRNVTLLNLEDAVATGREPAAPEPPGLVDREDQVRQEKQLRDAIDELPSGQRDCIRLQLGELTYEEMAKFLGISVDAVKSRIRDAKRFLRERLREFGSTPPENKP
jgi:RNA polymerase sigma-70 factor (ECF subfamily)